MKELRETIHSANLTKTQKMIGQYVLDNSADACFMTSTEIAMKSLPNSVSVNLPLSVSAGRWALADSWISRNL